MTVPLIAYINNAMREVPQTSAQRVLAEFLAAQGLSQNAFADRLGKSTGFFGDIMTGRRRPSFETAALIERLTDGLVTLSMWVRKKESVE